MYNKKLFISVIALTLLFILGLSFYLYKNPKSTNKTTSKDSADIAVAPANPQKGDAGYEEKDTVLESNAGSRLGGTIVLADESTITISNSGNQISYSLSENEIAIQCTSQKLLSASSVDINLVTNVKLLAPGRVSQIKTGEPVFLVGSENAGTFKVHTLFVSDDACIGL